MSRYRIVAFALLIIILASRDLHSAGEKAAADSILLYRIKEIVVTGRRIPMPVEDLALSVSVIGEREIQTTLKNSSTDLAGVARACGYRDAETVDNARDLATALERQQGAPGPSLLRVVVRRGARSDLGRPRLKPRDCWRRFSEFLAA